MLFFFPTELFSDSGLFDSLLLKGGFNTGLDCSKINNLGRRRQCSNDRFNRFRRWSDFESCRRFNDFDGLNDRGFFADDVFRTVNKANVPRTSAAKTITGPCGDLYVAEANQGAGNR